MAPAPKAEPLSMMATTQTRTSPNVNGKQPMLKSKYYQKPVKAAFAGALSDDDNNEEVFSPSSKPSDTPTRPNGNTNGAHWPARDDAPSLNSPLKSAPILRATGDSTLEGKPSGHRHTKSGGQILDTAEIPARKPVGVAGARSASVDTSSLDTPQKSSSVRKASEGSVVPKLSHKGRTNSLRDANKKSPAEVKRDADRRRKDEDRKRASWDGEAVDFLQRSDDEEEDQPETPTSEEKKPPEPATPPKLPELKLGNLFSWEDENVEVRDFAKQEHPLLPEFTLSKSLLDDDDDGGDVLGKSSDLLKEDEKDEKKEDEPKEEIPTEAKPEDEDADDEKTEDETAKDETLKPAALGDDKLGDKATEPVKKRSPRPSPAPIDTSGRSRRPLKKEPASKHPKTPPGQAKNGDAAESFLWNSPRSSADDSAKDIGLSPKPLDEELERSTPTKGDRPASTDSEVMSANALGFGAGPSDWEFLGDYDGEEVDDIHLYTSPKTQEPPMNRLPMITSTVEEVEPDGENLDPDDSPSVPSRPHLERKILSTIEERASEHFEDLFNGKKIEGQQGETIDTRAIFNAHPPPPPPGEDATDRGSSTLLQPNSSEGSQNRESVASSTDTIERISFHVPPPPESATSESSSKDSPAHDRPDYNREIPTSGNLAINNSEAAPLGPEVTTPKPVVPEEAAATSSTSLPRTKSASQSIKTGNSSRVLSRVSDDGKEEIMISLEIPRRSPPPAIPESDERSPPNKMLGQPSPDLLRSGGRRSIYPGSIELDNPYAGLEVWAKASLNRFIKVLHDEAAAKTNEEKYHVFVNLMRNEQRIRAVFYDQDEESDGSENQAKKQIQQAQPASVEEAIISPTQQPPGSAGARISKALPALPTEPEATPMGSPVQTPGEDALRGGLPLAQSLEASKNTNGTGDAAGETSPGDPNAKQNKDKNLVNLPGAASLTALRKALDIVTTRKSGLTPKDTQAMARASILRASGQPGREEFKADVKSPNSVTSPSDTTGETQPGSETTTPVDGHNGDMSPTEGKPYEGDKAANRQSIYQPFSNMLRASSIRSGRSDGGDWRKSHQGHPSVSESANGTDENGFLSPPQAMSPVAKGKRPVNVRHTVLEPLVVVVPQDSILRQEPEALVRLRQVMDTIPDDFSFIHKTVLSWDAEAKKARERYESERHVRQGQNEQRIDELFNEHEIGYSDISRLEADFKRAEAAKKAEEDREEVQTFVASVFDVVWARINYEMDQLKPLYDECTRLVADASAGRGMFEEDSSRVPIAPAMEALLILYQKLMVRHQKAFEAVLERDRRLKKVEVAPWYALGAVDKVKRIERRFEDAEKKAILEFCRQRDERANLLMDVLDQNTLRGVGANQDYMESVMQGVSKVSADLANGAVGDDDVVSTTEVLKAKTITTALARSSEQIVQTFHVADMLLNAADYEVSVANAKLIGADAAAFRRLRDAKAKEDQKLALDLEHRMGLIRGDTSRTQDEITKLLMLLQDRQGSKAAASALAESGMDPVHEEQLRKSLDAIVATKNGQGADA